jgi:hypothetical protein
MKQVITSDNASVVDEQPKKPCSDCPWARKAMERWLGPLTVHQWLALAHGEGIAQCHALKGPKDESFNCAGFAIYRANVAKSPVDQNAFRLPADREHVFSMPNEFAEHHGETFDAMKMMTTTFDDDTKAFKWCHCYGCGLEGTHPDDAAAPPHKKWKENTFAEYDGTIGCMQCQDEDVEVTTITWADV